MTKAHTLGDFYVPDARCSGCGEDLPSSAKVESYETSSSDWLLVECPRCSRCTPFQLEKA
jgi:hypothetical protein